MPFVSFCLATYKRGEILRDTLRSIQRQDFSDYEVIISDNDVEESGRAYVESLQDVRFRYFPNGANLGMKPSFNKSLERSSGEFIVMMADDDPVYHDMLSTLVTLYERYPDYGMYMGGCDWFCTAFEVGKFYKMSVGANSCLSSAHDLNFIKTFSPKEFLLQIFGFKFFKHYLWSTCMIRREIINDMGGIPEYGTPFLGDYAYLSVMGSKNGCVLINKSLGCQTLHKENFGRDQNEQILTAIKNFPDYLKERMPQIWHQVEASVFKFASSWVISHMAFLYHYNKESKMKIVEIEKEIFSIPIMRRLKMKYWLKTRMPFLHQQLVSLKNKF